MSSFARRLGLMSLVALFALSAHSAHAASPERIHISNNWAGYAATDAVYTGVSGSWTVPASVGTNRTLSADAAWVGIGGITDDDLIQVGTQAIIRNGRTEYIAWYELLPDTQQTIPLTVRAGDAMTASVTEVSDGIWRISITDKTTSQTYENTLAYDSSRSSAEWVVERPLAITQDASGYLPLSDFGTVTFTDASATAQGKKPVRLNGIAAEPLIMGAVRSRILAIPAGIDGGSFAVSYLSASQSTRYLRTLKRAYKLQPETNAGSHAPKYEEIDASYVVRVLF